MTLDVQVESSIDGFEMPEWHSLLADDPHSHIFATPEWNKVWWEEFGGGKELFILKLLRGEDTTAIVPLYRKPEGDRSILRFVGGIDLTDYLGPISAHEDRTEVADALVEWLASEEVRWNEFDAHNLPVPLGFADSLVERADRAGFSFALDQEETSALLPLPGSWDEYLASLDSKERHELKRKRRRLWREHPDAIVRTATQESLERDLKTFIEMHRGAEGHKGHFMRPDIATFFERLAHAFMPLGWLRLDLLEIDGTAISSTFSFHLDRALYLYNSAYEPEARRLSPGLVLVSELIKRSIDEGLDTFDFLRGPERYKYRIGGQAVPLNNVRILNDRER